jgi:TonB family protein
MDNFIIYLLKVAAGSAFFITIYLLLFRKETFYIRNRIFLILSIIIPVIVPLLTYTVTVNVNPQPLPVTDMSEFSDTVSSTAALVTASQTTSTSFSLTVIVMWIYFTGVIFFIIRGLISLLSTYIIIRSGKVISDRFPKVLLSDKNHPSFSFFPYAVIPVSEYIKGNYSDILDHEFAHLRQGHTFDLLLSEMFIAFQWFNPFAWLMKRYMVLNHEYLADHVSLSKRSIKDYQYRLLNIAGEVKTVSLAHTFNSLIKNRIIMINKRPTQRKAMWKTLLVLPVILIAVYAFSEPVYREVNNEKEQKGVTGIVTNEEGIPIEGVMVTSTGTTGYSRGASTNNDGKFQLLDVEEGASLIFTFTGYKKLILKPDFASEMKIKLMKDPDYKDPNPVSNVQVPQPMVIFDGKKTDQSYSAIYQKLGLNVGSFKFLRGKEATDKYGESGKNGVVEIYSYEKAVEMKLIPYRRKEADDYPTFSGKSYIAFNEYVINNTKYPEDARKNGIQGRVWANYTVNEDGQVEKVTIMGNPNPLLGAAVEKTCLESPKWDPPKSDKTFGPFESSVSVKFELPGKVIKDDVYIVSEVMPKYNDDDMGMLKFDDNMGILKFIAETAIYPEAAKKDSVEGRVIIRFIVNESGNIDEPIILKSIHPLLDNEAIRVVKLLSGRFTPGYQDGKPVSVYYMVPITFALARK